MIAAGALVSLRWSSLSPITLMCFQFAGQLPNLNNTAGPPQMRVWGDPVKHGWPQYVCVPWAMFGSPAGADNALL